MGENEEEEQEDGVMNDKYNERTDNHTVGGGWKETTGVCSRQGSCFQGCLIQRCRSANGHVAQATSNKRDHLILPKALVMPGFNPRKRAQKRFMLKEYKHGKLIR